MIFPLIFRLALLCSCISHAAAECTLNIHHSRPVIKVKMKKNLWEAMQPSEQSLAKKKCIPCQGGIKPLKGAELAKYQELLGSDWQVVSEHHLEKEWSFPDFATALEFTNRVGALAEQEGHHPDLYLAWGKVKITLWTHKIDGLAESDFILAAKCDLL